MSTTLNLTLHVWRQSGPDAPGRFERYPAEGVSSDMSFLELLDVINEKLIEDGSDPIAFEHDCREGVCGACGVVVNGRAHGPQPLTTSCQLHMRQFKDGDELWIEPWRTTGFPVIKDLAVDRSAFDRIIEAGGYVSVRTGSAPEANHTLVRKADSDHAFDAAACIGCGACVAACPNASGHLFLSAKVAHLALLPQGQTERRDRVRKMIAQHDAEGFGSCTNHGECESSCPKGISINWIALMNREFLSAMIVSEHPVKTRKGRALKVI